MALDAFAPDDCLLARGLDNDSKMHCYWNSVLQALMSSPPFTQLIFRIDSMPQINKGSFICTFASFIRGEITNMQLYKKYILSLYVIGKCKEQLQELISNQQCVSETMQYILEIFEKCEPITNLFTHRYLKSLICIRCKQISNKKESGTIIAINPNEDLPDTIFESAEQIDDCQCDQCERKGIKQIINKLVMVPEIISIMIKKYVWENGSGKKTNDGTMFPEFITIDKFKYRSVAYINHYGNINCGHYITTALRKVSNNGGGNSTGNNSTGDNSNSDNSTGGNSNSNNSNITKLTWVELNDGIVSNATYSPGSDTYMIIYNYVE